MIYVSEPYSDYPKIYETPLKKKVYEVLKDLSIPFLRVDCDDAITMEACLDVDRALDVMTVKTLFLCNRQQTDFYLFVTKGDKRFVTKDFSSAMGISRVSFASPDQLWNIAGTRVGATTVFSSLLDSASDVTIVIDSEVLSQEYIACTDGMASGFVKIKTKDLTDKILPYSGHVFRTVNV